MGLWMRSFGDRGAAIVEAESMIHARLRVAVKGLIRASLFVGGCQIDPEFIPLIPDESIGRKLTREHTANCSSCLNTVRRDAKQWAHPLRCWPCRSPYKSTERIGSSTASEAPERYVAA